MNNTTHIAKFDITDLSTNINSFNYQDLRIRCNGIYKVNLFAFSLDKKKYLSFTSNDLQKLHQSIAYVFFNLKKHE